LSVMAWPPIDHSRVDGQVVESMESSKASAEVLPRYVRISDFAHLRHPRRRSSRPTPHTTHCRVRHTARLHHAYLNTSTTASLSHCLRQDHSTASHLPTPEPRRPAYRHPAKAPMQQYEFTHRARTSLTLIAVIRISESQDRWCAAESHDHATANPWHEGPE